MPQYYYLSGYVQMVPCDTPPVVGGGPIIPPQPPVYPSHPIMLPGMPGWGGGGPVDPGYSPPWSQVPIRPPGPVDPGYSPPWARPPVDPGFGNPWFDPHPSHPIMLPGMPGWGSGGPVDPGYSPPWAQVPDPNRPHPSHPIMLPGMPGWGVPPIPPIQPPQPPQPPVFLPLPPDMEAPPENPTELPDLASPGFWCLIQDGLSRSYKPAFIQVAINTSADHVPKPPEKGIPGTWVAVYGGMPPVVADAWVPSPEVPEINPLKKEKHAKPSA